MNSLRHWKIVLILLAIFVTGGVTGGVLTLRGVKKAAERTNVASDAWPKWTLKMYSKRLELTPEQEQKLQPVFDRAGQDFKDARVRAMYDMLGVLRTLNDDVQRELTPDQQVKLEQLKEEVRTRMMERRKNQQKGSLPVRSHTNKTTSGPNA